VAHLITLARICLVFLGITLLYAPVAWGAAAACLAILAVFVLDGIDGFVARKLGTDSPAGAAIDIMGDRVVENSLWIVFAHLHLVPIWAPLISLARGLMTDAVRAIAFTKGKTPFGRSTLHTSRLGKALVASETSRFLYAAAKMTTFTSLSLLVAGRRVVGTPAPWLHALELITPVLVIFTIGFCLLRGLPVLWDGWSLLRRAPTVDEDGCPQGQEAIPREEIP